MKRDTNNGRTLKLQGRIICLLHDAETAMDIATLVEATRESEQHVRYACIKLCMGESPRAERLDPSGRGMHFRPAGSAKKIPPRGDANVDGMKWCIELERYVQYLGGLSRSRAS